MKMIVYETMMKEYEKEGILDLSDFPCFISHIPTVDAEEIIHGHWVEYNDSKIDGKMWTCSECGLLSYAFMFGRQIANYCPHCGAKMDNPV